MIRRSAFRPTPELRLVDRLARTNGGHEKNKDDHDHARVDVPGEESCLQTADEGVDERELPRI